MPARLILLFFSIWFVASYVPAATGQEKRFVTIPFLGRTDTFDLSTVQEIIPGRFTIISTTIDDPDVMRFELRVLDTLQTYCARPDGKYPASDDTFTLGPPDMPIQNVIVRSSQTKTLDRTCAFKSVTWGYPYKRLTVGRQEHVGFLTCEQWCKPPGQLYEEMSATITNGIQTKTLFDCGRGLVGWFINITDGPSKALLHFVKKDTFEELDYVQVCYAVTHAEPYLPK